MTWKERLHDWLFQKNAYCAWSARDSNKKDPLTVDGYIVDGIYVLVVERGEWLEVFVPASDSNNIGETFRALTDRVRRA